MLRLEKSAESGQKIKKIKTVNGDYESDVLCKAKTFLIQKLKDD